MRVDTATPCLLGAIISLLLAGCGGTYQSSIQETYSVEGRVTFDDGQPVAGVLVSFSSLDGTVNSSAMTDDEGRYRVDAEDGEGLPAGGYRVAVGPPINAREAARHPAIDPRYANKKMSGLTVTIKPLANYYDIEVERADD